MPNKIKNEEHMEHHGKSYSKGYNDETRKTAENDGIRWSRKEIEILMDTSIPMTVRAKKLKRTYKACDTKLYVLSYTVNKKRFVPLKKKSAEDKLWDDYLG